MAEGGEVPVDSRYMDYAEHERTYRLFLTLARNVAIVVAVIVILMAVFLV